MNTARHTGLSIMLALTTASFQWTTWEAPVKLIATLIVIILGAVFIAQAAENTK